MASIAVIDLNNAIETLTGSILKDFTLTNPDDIDFLIPELEAGRTEEVGAQLYQVIDGNLTPSGSPSDGTVYLYIEDVGGGVVNATLSNTVPTWNGQGWYNSNAKAVFIMKKASAVYSSKKRIPNSNDQDIRGTVPIGSIIGVHPDLKALALPNTRDWSPCDGVATMPTDYFDTGNDTKVPDLTDDRFLAGASAYGTGAQSDHNHQWYDRLASENSTDQSFNSAGSLVALPQVSYAAGSGRALFTGLKGAGTIFLNDQYTGNVEGSDVIKPKYFNVIYYMRIN